MPDGAGRREQFYPKADTPVPDAELRSLSGSGALVGDDVAAAIVEQAGIRALSIERLATGTFHELFTVRSEAEAAPLVLKVTRVAPDGGLEVEAAVTARLGDAGVPTVRVHRTGSLGGAEWSLSDFADGPSLRALDGDDDAVLAALPRLAEHLRLVHGVPVQGWGLLAGRAGEGSRATWADYLLLRLEEHLAALIGIGALDAGAADSVRAALQRAALLDPGPARLLHGDIGPHNAILGDDVRLIDWEDALAGDPAFDVAMWATFNPVRRWPVFFAAYHGADWEPDFRFWAYFLRISVAKSVVRSRFGYTDVPGREPASARIPRALDAIALLPDPQN